MLLPRYFAGACAALTIVLASSTMPAAGADFTRLLSALPTDDPGKIEVIEFFWYGCPHCRALEPMVEDWERRLPKDVAFRREHVIWDGRGETETHARIFLTLRAMGLLAQHHRAVFDALHVAKARLRSEPEIFDWAAKRGIDRAKFEAAFKSFGVSMQLTRAKDLTAKYLVDGVPSFAVNGKFKASMGRGHDEKRLFAVIDKLIAGERKP
ncbi:MAG TPA: thiol:disulfide interchange protein DsbA/DsbL [Burkholderiales bacterium]|nr:thiol:disulfide interchange protein DsbA/DsbL [Burkholderiales bacterium]